MDLKEGIWEDLLGGKVKNKCDYIVISKFRKKNYIPLLADLSSFLLSSALSFSNSMNPKL